MTKKEQFLKLIQKTILNEISSREYQKTVSATPSQKSRNAYKLVKKKLAEVDKILEYSGKLNEEIGGFKLNEEQLGFIREKINSIRDKSKGILSEDLASSILGDITSFLNGIKDKNEKVKTINDILKHCKQLKTSIDNPVSFKRPLKEEISKDDVNSAALTLHNYAKQTGNMELGELIKKVIQLL